MKIICLDGERQYLPIVERDVMPLLHASGITLDWRELQLADVDAVIAAAQGYDGVYVIGDQGPLPRRLIEEVPSLRLISFVGTGAERFVDLAQAREAGVAVTNVPDFASQSVAEHALALIFAVARRIPSGDADIRQGAWVKEQGLLLKGRRLGVLGLGSIGERLAHMGQALGMEVSYFNRTPRPELEGMKAVSLEELLETSDVLSVHLLHTPETDGLITGELLSRLPDQAVVVNTARAEVFERGAVEAALASGRLFGAGIDVFTEEPPRPETLPAPESNAVLSPHVGFHTDEADAVFSIAAQNIVEFLAGRSTNRVENI
jgi:phosphoglycerate dehydrogenase-like enzyme